MTLWPCQLYTLSFKSPGHACFTTGLVFTVAITKKKCRRSKNIFDEMLHFSIALVWFHTNGLIFRQSTLFLVTASVKTRSVLKQHGQGFQMKCVRVKKVMRSCIKVMFLSHDLRTWLFHNHPMTSDLENVTIHTIRNGVKFLWVGVKFVNKHTEFCCNFNLLSQFGIFGGVKGLGNVRKVTFRKFLVK